jgi:hypothetical protein
MPRSLTDLLLVNGAIVSLAVAAGAFWYAWRRDAFSSST